MYNQLCEMFCSILRLFFKEDTVKDICDWVDDQIDIWKARYYKLF